MKKVLIIAQFTQLPGEIGNNRGRFKYLCEKLVDSGYQVTEVTSSFRDVDKVQRDYSKTYFKDNEYEIVILDDPGYKKNISINRIISQKKFAVNLKKWLDINGSKYDLIYCCNPPHDGAYEAGKYAKNNKIPFVIDVQDLWPEAMKMAINIPYISDFIFLPMKLKAKKVYSFADGIVAVSQTYVDRAKLDNTNKKLRESTVFIGTNINYFDKETEKEIKLIEKNEKDFWVTYSGSLSYSYDIETLIKSISYLYKNGYENIKLNILGSGPLENNFKELAKRLELEVNFTGWKSYGEMGAYLKKSDIVVNAIRKIAPQSITNKIGDYFAASVPILNGSPNKELRDLVEAWGCGKNYISEDIYDLSNKIIEIYKMDLNERNKMSEKARVLAENLFNRDKSYSNIIDLIEKCIEDRF